MNPIVVTGAQGFIGRYVVATLLAEEVVSQVIGLGRSARCPKHFTHSVHCDGALVRAQLTRELETLENDGRYTYVSTDLVNAAAVQECVNRLKPGLVIHLAGSLRDEPFGKLLSNNILATYNLACSLSALRNSTRLVIASSGSVYGHAGADGTSLSGATYPYPIDLYSATKRAAEDIASVMKEGTNLETVIDRIFKVIGTGKEVRHLTGHHAN